jgi:RNA polymerase sigma factor (sigma-70 family)
VSLGVYFSTKEDFDALLCWLDSDRDRAAEKYEEIRHRLITIFERRHCGNPEDLADAAINRVLQKVRSLKESYAGDPALYFYSVARNIAYESQRQAVREIDIDAVDIVDRPSQDDLTEERFEVMHEWLNTLTDSDRSMLLDYFTDEGIAKIERRKKLREALGLSSMALRQRVHRLRMDGEKWMRTRLEERKVLKG